MKQKEKKLSENDLQLVKIYAASKADEATKDNYSNQKWSLVFDEAFYLKEKEMKGGLIG